VCLIAETGAEKMMSSVTTMEILTETAVLLLVFWKMAMSASQMIS
jgi:hypothetical protein